MQKFKATLEIIGINPFVFVPERILLNLFKQSGKTKGSMPICGTVNGQEYKQTLVKYKSEWRFYINTSMLKDSPKRIGEILNITIQFDPVERKLTPDPDFVKALNKNAAAKKIFYNISPSLQKEIVRYILSLKSNESRMRNIERAIGYLTGKNKFIGRAPGKITE